MSAKGSEQNARVATRRMTNVQKLVVTMLNEHGGEDHLGENDTDLELDEYMTAEDVTEAERRQCSDLLIAGGVRWTVHTDESLMAEDDRAAGAGGGTPTGSLQNIQRFQRNDRRSDCGPTIRRTSCWA